MGNGPSSDEEHSDDSETVERKQYELTPTQIRMVKALWKEARRRGPDEPGRSILTGIIGKCPEVSDIFGFSVPKKASTVSRKTSEMGRQLTKTKPENDELGIHAVRFTNAMDNIMNTIHDRAKAEIFLKELGKRHVGMRSDGFRPDLWNVFGECMIEKTLEWGTRSQRSATVQDAWSKIANFIISKMKDGYYDEMKMRKKSSVSMSAYSPPAASSPS